jgi:O-glycosyl hydrolase
MKNRFASRSLALLASTILLAMCGTKQAPPGTSKPSSGGRVASGGQPATGGQTSGGTSTSNGGNGGSGGVVDPGGSRKDAGAAGAGGTTSATGGRVSGGTAAGGAGPVGGGFRDAAVTGDAPGSGGASADAPLATDGRSSPDLLSGGGSPTGGGTAKGGAAGTTAAGGSSGTGGKPTVVAAPGTTLVKVDARTKHQTFEGWGTSLAWWAYQIGGWSSSKKNQFADLLVDPVAGLGYNIFRYNIGGGDAPNHNHMGANRQMPGFQSSDGTWDWNADARQTSVLTRLLSTGKNVIVEAFSNSPPYWMTKSGCASGSTDGSNNLKDDSYNAFADYLTEVTKHYHDALGIQFRTLEPLNEPNANWWKAQGGQEGCHFGASNQQSIIKAVSAALATKGLADTHVSASDENSMDDATSIMNGYDATTWAAMAQMNVHSYAGSKRTQLRALATSKGKRLWQSESGPLSVDLASNTDAAIFMAGRIIQDLRDLQPEAWIEWQVVDPGANWTSFTVNDAQQTFTPVKRFYMQAGFTRTIRPGATFIDINNADMVAAMSADSAAVTIVVRNGDTTTSKGFTFDLTSLPSIGGSAEAYRTSASEDLVHLPAVTVQNWSFSATVPAYSVTSFVIAL